MKSSTKKALAFVLAALLVIISIPVAKSYVANAAASSSVVITECGGWLESAYVKWNTVNNAKGYNVYYKSANANDSEYKQLDDSLIRQYKTYFRADIPGLKAGEYVMKVVPIVSGSESAKLAATTDKLTVVAHTREGFAFSEVSPAKTGSGGYNDDGTVPSNAQIVYVTDETKDTVKLDVITNSKGSKTTCTGLVDIFSKRQKGYDTTPLIIRLVGQINDPSGLNSNGYLQIKGCKNITLEGIGDDASVYGWGLLIRNSQNIEVRNLAVMLFDDDGISLDTNNQNIWIHNNEIFYGNAGSDSDQAKGDGSCDVKQNSTFVTVSYNHFWDSGKCSLCGMSDTEEFFVTYHHNWFDHSDSRHPRIRVGSIHVYNNYYDGNSKYGVGVTKGSSAFVEANYFRNCKNPMMSSLQGTDALGQGTFSGEAGGMIKAYNNTVIGASSLIYANAASDTASANAKSFDAYLASSASEQVPSSYKTVSGGTTYNNFDTSSTMYKYTADSPEQAKDNVVKYAGRVNGGDFEFTFTSADDTSYAVNTELMSAIRNYKIDLVKVGGSSIVAGGTTTTEPAEKETTTEAEKETTTKETTTAGSTQKPSTEVTSDGVGTTTNLLGLKDSAFKNAIYVAPNANGDGSESNPMDLEKAIKTVKAGSAIIMKDGTYSYDHEITIESSNSGTKDAYKILRAADNATVTLDFSKQSYNSNDTSKNDRGIQLDGNYWYIEGITVYGAADNGIYLTGSNNIVENCILQANRDTGLQISRRDSSVAKANWPSNNYVINCTSFDNCDPATNENADGFAAKLTCGDGNVFDGCISYCNSDDGWDLYAKEATGSIGVVTIKNCVAFNNGHLTSGESFANGDMNGFKLGGSNGKVPTPHVVENSLAFGNGKHGFTDNGNGGKVVLTNCTAYDNAQVNYQMNRSTSGGVNTNLMSYKSTGSDAFIGTIENSLMNTSKKYYFVDAITNVNKSKVGTQVSEPTNADFVSLSAPKADKSVHANYRNADGTVNMKGFLETSSSSKYAELGCKFASNAGTKLTVPCNANQSSEGEKPTQEETTTQAPTQAPTQEETTEKVTEEESKGETTVTGTLVYNPTKDGTTADGFTITGSTTSKGSASYDGLTLKKVLKLDSKASIKFTTSKDATVTVVAKAKSANSTLSVDGSTDIVTGLGTDASTFEFEVSAGEHTIKRGNKEAYVYYVVVTEKGSSNSSSSNTAKTYTYAPEKDGLATDYFTAAGSTSTSKGNATYNNETYKTCLKFDSSAKITFTTTKANATLRIVVKGKSANAELSLNNSTEGLTNIGTDVVVKEVTLTKAGTYELKKADVESYVYYIEVVE